MSTRVVQALDRRKLTRSPLVNAIWQLKYTSEAPLGAGRAVMMFQSALRHNTSLSPVQEQSVSVQLSMGIAPVGGAQSAQADAWRLVAEDGKTAVTVAPGIITLETSEYGSWDHNFFPWIEDVVRAAAETLAPGLTTRIGLRYVNAIFGRVFENAPFSDLGDFADFVHPTLLGFGVGEGALEVAMIQGRQVLVVGEAKVNLNHALVQTEASEAGVLLDVDAYSEETVVFDPDAVVRMTDHLHDTALSVFQQCVTPKAWLAMDPIEEKKAESQ